MKLFTKKTLAILLSALIVLGSVSIAALAAPAGKITATTTFYDADNNTAEKVYAKPGDTVKAVVSVTSDFNVGSMAFEYQYDSKMFTPDFTKSAAASQGYELIPAAGSEMTGFYTDGATTAPGGNPADCGTLYFSVQKFKVQQYADAPAFEVYFTINSDVPVDEEGNMIVMPNSTRNGDNDDYPTEADYVTNDAVVGTNQPLTVDDFLPAEDYELTVESTSNVVVVKGSVKYDPNGGTIDGSADPVTVDGYYGAAITENEKKPADITPTAPSGSEFKGWGAAADATTPLTDTELAAITNAKAGEETTLYAIYEALPVSITFDVDGGNPISVDSYFAASHIHGRIAIHHDAGTSTGYLATGNIDCASCCVDATVSTA